MKTRSRMEKALRGIGCAVLMAALLYAALAAPGLLMAYNLLSQTHDGWKNGEGAYGDFTFSLEERSVTLEYNERHTEATYHQHTF